MSDTPRTEAEVARLKGPTDDLITIDANFAAQLERELTAAQQRIKRLEEAGDGLLELCEAEVNQHHLADQIDARCKSWRKAKEDKP